jgi:hypothetical protein
MFFDHEFKTEHAVSHIFYYSYYTEMIFDISCASEASTVLYFETIGKKM